MHADVRAPHVVLVVHRQTVRHEEAATTGGRCHSTDGQTDRRTETSRRTDGHVEDGQEDGSPHLDADDTPGREWRSPGATRGHDTSSSDPKRVTELTNARAHTTQVEVDTRNRYQ